MELSIELIGSKKENEQFHGFFKKNNPRGAVVTENQQINPISSGEMSGLEYTTVLTLILNSAATVVVLKGIFNTIKEFIELKKQTHNLKHESSKVIFTRQKKDGKKESIELYIFNEEERIRFLDFFNS